MKTLLYWLENEAFSSENLNPRTEYASYEHECQTFCSASSERHNALARRPSTSSPPLVKQKSISSIDGTGRATSINSIKKISLDGTRVHQTERLFHYLLFRGRLGATGNQMSRDLGLPPGRVSARINDLRRIVLPCDEPLVINDGVVVDPVSGHNNVVWVINPSFNVPSGVYDL